MTLWTDPVLWDEPVLWGGVITGPPGTLLADARPVTRFYLGLTANPYDALSTVVWTEIPAALVKSRTIRWGAQHELARVEPSYASLTLDNTGGEFETLNTASPYYPNLRPLNRLRITDTWAGVTYNRFTGYVTDWPRSWTGINSATVRLEAYDALGAVLNAVDVPNHPWEMEVRNLIENVPSTGKAVWLRLNETSGTVAADSSGFNLDGQYQGAPVLGVASLVDHDDDKAFSPVAGSRVSLPYKNLITGYPWSLTCWFLTSQKRDASKMIFSAYDGPSGGGSTERQYLQVAVVAGDPVHEGELIAMVASPYPTGTQVRSTVTVDDGIRHHLAIVFVSSSNFRLYVDGVNRTNLDAVSDHAFPNDLNTGYAVGNTPAVTYGDFRFAATAGDALDEVLVLDGMALTSTQVAELYAAGTSAGPERSGVRLGKVLDSVGWPSADRAIDTGQTTVRPGWVSGKASAMLDRLALTEGSRLFVDGSGVITFHDRHKILKAPYTTNQMTFGEGAGEVRYAAPFNHGEDDGDIYNDVQMANVDGIVQVARSKASKDRYGWKTLSRTDLLGTSNEEAKDRANRDLALYKDPVMRVRQVVVHPQEDAAQGTAVWPALLSLGQQSRVTVKATPPGSTAITQISHVERMDETVTANEWQVTLGLSAAQTQTYAMWGTSTWGGARWSY